MTGYFFNGRQNITPQAMTHVNDGAMLPAAPSVGNFAALIGHSTGGAPGVVLKFGSPDDARSVLASGELLDGVIRAFAPSAETGGPDAVIAVRVDPATPATLALKDSIAATVINLTSTNYGLRENQIKVKVEAATGGRGLKITTQRGSSYYTQDNIFRNAFSVQYSGAQASAVAQISQSQVVLQAPSGSTVATIDLNTFQTIQQLVDRINATAGFSAAVLDGNGSKKALDGLDTVAAQDVKTAVYNARADLQAVVDWFNTSGEPYVTAARAASVGTLPAPAAFTYLSGGIDGTSTNTEWSNAFSALQTADVQWITPLTSDPAVHAMADAHVQFMSDQGRKERRAICGGPLATSDATAITLAKGLNSDRTSFVHLGVYDYDVLGDGSLKLYPPYMAAAMISGAFAGVTPGTALTGVSLSVVGAERTLRNPVDTDGLLQGGVLPIEDTATGVRVTQSISTWLTDGKFNRREQSTGAALDFACRFIRERVETAVKGKKGSPQMLSVAITTMETCCKELAKPEELGGLGVLAGDAANPAYMGLKASLNGDVLALVGQLSPVIPINYIPITINAVPYSGTASIG
jgi:hypothetical protein